MGVFLIHLKEHDKFFDRYLGYTFSETKNSIKFHG